jgi:hypothetical protein
MAARATTAVAGLRSAPKERPPRTDASNPQEGSHQTTRQKLPPAAGQVRYFIQEFNHERPHQALNMKYPGELYSPLAATLHRPKGRGIPFHDRTITVTQCGRICVGRRKINLSTVFAGQDIGILEVSEQIWLVSFMQYDLGFFDHETGPGLCPESLRC